jgi:signal peptidase II
MVPLNRYLAFFGIALTGCALDLVTKHWVFERLGPPEQNNVWWIWRGYVGLQTATNTGALFGVGQDLAALLAGISIVAMAGILYWLFLSRAAHNLGITIALGAVFGGILGNLYDRLGLWGSAEVRDWILLRYDKYTWPNFNVADSLLVCGAALLIWLGFRPSSTDLDPKPVGADGTHGSGDGV